MLGYDKKFVAGMACASLVVLAAPSLSANDCRHEADIVAKCTIVGGTYSIETPETPEAGGAFPTVVILHDAGERGRDIVDNARLKQAFLERGFAVIAPSALPRQALRLSLSGTRCLSQTTPFEDSTARRHYPSALLLMSDGKGGVRYLRYGKDTGWYYYNVDRVKYPCLPNDTVPLGRDEIQFLRTILADAAEKFRTEITPTMIAGVGHGGSLVWQIACHAPSIAPLLAPIGGAYWISLPKTCVPGAHVVHTHQRNSAFWPLQGAPKGKYRFARTSVLANLEMLLSINLCTAAKTTDRDQDTGVTHTAWGDCARGGPVEILLHDEPFAFQDWWLTAMLERIGNPSPAPEAPEEPVEISPEFSTADEETGFLTPEDATGFQKPGSEPGFQRAGSSTGFQKAGSASGFQKAGEGAGSQFKPAR